MVELIGDICRPSELTIPNKATAGLPTAPNEGMIYMDTTAHTLKVWNGTAYKTVTMT